MRARLVGRFALRCVVLANILEREQQLVEVYSILYIINIQQCIWKMLLRSYCGIVQHDVYLDLIAHIRTLYF